MLRLTAVDRTEHFVGDDYVRDVTSSLYRTQCGKQVRASAMIVGPQRRCAECFDESLPAVSRTPHRSSQVERWLRTIGIAA